MQQTLHINPMKVDRKSTNFIFIFVFILIFFTWLYFVIGISYHNPSTLIETSPISVLGIMYFRLEFPLVVTFSGLIAFLYTYFLSRSSGRVIVHIAVWLICVWMLLSVLSIVTTTVPFFENMPAEYYFLYFFMAIYTAYLVTSFYCARKVGIKVISEFIKDSARAVISRPGIPLFALVISIISNVYFGSIFLYCVMLAKSNRGYVILLCFGLWIVINVLSNLTKIVISGCVIDWFWEKDQNFNSLTVYRSFKRTLRFHLGTVAFASIPFLSHICSILTLMRCRISDGDFIKKYHFSIRFFSQLCVFIYIPDFALIQTAIYGYGHWTGIMAAHDLVAQNNHRFNLAVSEVSMFIANLGYILMCTPILSFLWLTPASIMFIYATIIPFYTVFTTAVRTLTVNKMIIEYTSETVQDDYVGGRKVVPPRSQTSV